MKKYLHIGINWVGSPKADEIHKLIEANSPDWFKYGGNSWVVWTEYDQDAWAEFLRPHIGERSSIVIYEITNLAASNGYLPQGMWEWFKRFRY